MTEFDVLTAYAISGVGALVGAALMRPSLAGDPPIREAMRLTRLAYVLLGIGLGHQLLLDRPQPMWSSALMAAGSMSTLLAVGWATFWMAGSRPSRHTLFACIGLTWLVVAAALPLGTAALVQVCAWGLAIGATAIGWAARRLVLAPRDGNERLLGLLLVGTMPSYWLRCYFAVTWDGLPPEHLLHLPPALVPVYAVMYGVLPILFALLLFNVVNARLMKGLHERAMTDQLTGALSRHALADGAAVLTAQAVRERRVLGVLMLDLDHFKQINDRFGHAVGDAVLRKASALLREHLRPEALLARYGGEEFIVLLPVDDLPVARRVAERLRTSLGDTDWAPVAPGLQRVSASFGVTLLQPGESLEAALARADEALYRAKHSGRDQVQVALSAA
jgi:diguanylate cyclase (GGDEF)-like protein